jgi:two-component system chemotaxis response regulator CheB
MAYGIVVVGASAGGAHSLAALLSGLPRGFPLPVVAVLHRGQDSTDTLTESLQRSSVLRVKEAQDKEPLVPGSVYLAPPDYHLLVEKDNLGLSTEGPVHWARPSIDVLFESAADTWAERTIGVILTGANADGAQGLACIKRRGGLAVVQDPSEAQYRAMPDAAIAAAKVDRILPLKEIARLLAGLCIRPTG